MEVSTRRSTDEARLGERAGELDEPGRRVGAGDDQLDVITDALRRRRGKISQQSMALAGRRYDNREGRRRRQHVPQKSKRGTRRRELPTESPFRHAQLEDPKTLHSLTP